MNDAKVHDRKLFFAGQKIFSEGDAGDRAYLIQDGEIEIIKNGVPLAKLGKGALFGEMALIDNEPRMATAKAISDVTTVAISRDVFHDKLAKEDVFIRGLLNIFIRNIRQLAR